MHPVEDNLPVYSLRYYELLLRASTEFESVCKNEIANRTLSNKSAKDLNIEDYFKLEEFFRKNNPSKPGEAPVHQLAAWKVGFLFDPIIYRQPLIPWKTTHVLPWYQSYNKVKHNRQQEYQRASLENVLDAIGGLFIVLMILDTR